jgi:hypothetical protein
MGSWIECFCGARIHTNLFSGTDIYRLIVDSDYDAVEDPVDRDKLADLFLNKGIPVYHCRSCGRLLVEWDDKGGPTVYLPEGKRVEVPITESTTAGNDRDDSQRLNELEAMAEAEYEEMYDARSPTGCYSRAKDAFHDAIALAAKMGRQADAERLEKRLQHVKEVFRRQFA